MTMPAPPPVAPPSVANRPLQDDGATVILSGVTVFYGEVIGLSTVDLRVAPGITGIVGPNGSGKTTLMRVLTGLVDAGEGSVRVLGQDPFRAAEVRAKTSFVPAIESFFENVSARRNLEIAFLARGYTPAQCKERSKQALDIVDLEKPAGRRFGTWSRGMRQRLKLGFALAIEADVVLLDEPFLGVDPPSRVHLRELIARLGAAGRTVIVSSHVLHEVESLTDRVGILASGRLLGFGRIGELLDSLRDQHPHRVRLELTNARALAVRLMAIPHVRELKLDGDDALEFITDRPDLAYRDLPAVVVAADAIVRKVYTEDNTLEALFTHITAAGAHRL